MTTTRTVKSIVFIPTAAALARLLRDAFEAKQRVLMAHFADDGANLENCRDEQRGDKRKGCCRKLAHAKETLKFALFLSILYLCSLQA